MQTDPKPFLKKVHDEVRDAVVSVLPLAATEHLVNAQQELGAAMQRVIECGRESAEETRRRARELHERMAAEKAAKDAVRDVDSVPAAD